MTILVTDTGFSEVQDLEMPKLADVIAQELTPDHVDIPSDAAPEDLALLPEGVELVRIDFPNFADGRGMTLAKRLRLLGYTGTLRAKGHVIADQYAMARRSGFDEVEIDEDLAKRQPEDQWLFRADWQEHDYQKRLRG